MQLRNAHNWEKGHIKVEQIKHPHGLLIIGNGMILLKDPNFQSSKMQFTIFRKYLSASECRNLKTKRIFKRKKIKFAFNRQKKKNKHHEPKLNQLNLISLQN